MKLETRLAEIKKRCEAVTEGSLKIVMSHPNTEDDAKFIAHARTDVPMLLKMVELLRNTLERIDPEADLWPKIDKELEKIAEKYK